DCPNSHSEGSAHELLLSRFRAVIRRCAKARFDSGTDSGFRSEPVVEAATQPNPIDVWQYGPIGVRSSVSCDPVGSISNTRGPAVPSHRECSTSRPFAKNEWHT